ncbi:MAG: hypothetical protein ACRC0G_01565, partial [Fusobacteriaceae bacterium]
MLAFNLAWKMIRGSWQKYVFSFIGIILSVAVMVAITSLSRGGQKVIESNLSYLEGENMTVVSRNLGNKRDIKYLETLDFVNYAIPKAPIFKDLKSGK